MLVLQDLTEGLHEQHREAVRKYITTDIFNEVQLILAIADSEKAVSENDVLMKD